MKKQKTHTDRKHERALQRKQERQQNREQGNVSKQMPADIPLLNIRVACSAVLALLAIAVALKAYETPVPSADQRAVINLRWKDILPRCFCCFALWACSSQKTSNFLFCW